MPGAHKTVGKMLATKPGDLSSVILGTHSERRDWIPPGCPLTPPCIPGYPSILTVYCTANGK